LFSDREGSAHIYVMNADGTGATRISKDTGAEALPSWSPDGTQIAFVSDRAGPGSVYVMNADGTGSKRLTNAPEEDRDPAWSPVTSP
jgi:Tol biopolymer transport system component